MDEPKKNETKRLNQILMALAGVCVLVALWNVATSQFRGGTDDLFLVLTALMLAALFAISPLMEMRARAAATAEADEAEMAAFVPHEAHGGSNKENVIIWGGLLFLTAIEVLLAYIHINLIMMLIILMGLSVIKAALIVAYFMHLKFERLSLILTIVPTVVVLLCLFAILFPDSFRLHKMRPAETVQQVEHEG